LPAAFGDVEKSPLLLPSPPREDPREGNSEPADPACRALGGVLYFLVTRQTKMRMHRIRSDQMYHHYLGAPLEVLLLYPGGKSDVRVVGPDLMSGQRPQLLVPGGTFHVSRLQSGGEYALLATSVWLCAEPVDVELG